MRKLAVTASVVLAAVAVTVLGLLGAYGYGRDYSQHRGFTALVQLRRAGTGRLLAVHYYSQALHRNADYMVYLPPGYTPRHRYPVYYLLHGMPGKPRVFVDIANMDVRLDNQLALGRARPMILVYPDGRIRGSAFSDSEWANTPSGNFESYVIEVMHDVDQRFSTLARRQDRIIAGFSAGAYGAINIALHHLADFAGVQTWSGYFMQTRAGVFARATHLALAYNSPFQYVARIGHALARYPLSVYMFVGREDGASVQQLPMARMLAAAGAAVQYSFYPGGHDWSVWYPRLNQMLDLASSEASHPPDAVAAGGLRQAGQPAPARAVASRPHHRSELRLLVALLLALISSALINIGFILQQRGHARARAGGRDALAGGFREPVWLLGQLVGWLGFGGQIVAVALAPLTLVQAFSAGSLALSVPLAARIFGHRVRAPQLAAIAIIAVSLISLPIGFGAGHGHLHAGLLIASALLIALAAAMLAPRGGEARSSGAAGDANGAKLAIAAGALYGAADAAIKAASIGVRFHGTSVLSGWTLLAGLCTLGGFVAFQAALRDGDEVQPLTLMNAFTALAALGLGMAAFGEPLGATPAAGILHGVAIVLVLVCVRPLAGAQLKLAEGAPRAGAQHQLAEGAPLAGADLSPAAWLGVGVAARSRFLPRLRDPTPNRCLRSVAVWALAAAGLIVCSTSALGLLYALRQDGWLAAGPPVPDALPLLQLAGFDAQPLARVLASTLLAGLVLGVAMIGVQRRRRLIVVGALALLVFLVGSDASYALARNLRLGGVLLNRSPALGPFLEAVLFTAASALPGPVAKLRVPSAASRLADRRVLAPALAAGLAVALTGVLVLPGAHARAQSRTPRVVPSAPTAQFVGSGSAPPPAPTRRHVARRAPGRLLTVHFYSHALRRVADYLVYLPGGYNRTRRLPVFYMLHGMPGQPLAFTLNARVESKLERLIRQRRAAPMILVFPDGRIRGNAQTDSEWANTRYGAYESYVVDVVHNVDRRFATLPYRQDRAIAGLSAGAYGALNVGLHQVKLFGLIQVWSGYFTQTRTGVFSHASRSWLLYNSPLDFARTIKPSLPGEPLRVFLYVGNHDGDASPIAPMAAVLRAAGAAVRTGVFSGGHDWKLWSGRMDQMLVMASRYFAPAPRGLPAA